MSVRLRISRLDVVEGAWWKVRELDLELAEATVLALLGGAGAGKSVLLRTIAGLHAPEAGRIDIDGDLLDGADPAAATARGIGFAAQRARLFTGLTVRQNLLLGAAGRGRGERRAALARVLALLPELAQRPHRAAMRLSLPERRLVDLGRALMARPRLLLLDEPLSSLAPARLGRLLEELRAEGAAVLMAERLATPALLLADRGCLLHSGRLIVAGEPAALAEDPRVHAACLGESPPP